MLRVVEIKKSHSINFKLTKISSKKKILDEMKCIFLLHGINNVVPLIFHWIFLSQRFLEILKTLCKKLLKVNIFLYHFLKKIYNY